MNFFKWLDVSRRIFLGSLEQSRSSVTLSVLVLLLGVAYGQDQAVAGKTPAFRNHYDALPSARRPARRGRHRFWRSCFVQ
jgi:hypothetical protein